MKQQALALLRFAGEEGLAITLVSPSGLHPISTNEAIDAINEGSDIRVQDTLVIFGIGDVCISVEDPDVHNEDVRNHVTEIG